MATVTHFTIGVRGCKKTPPPETQLHKIALILKDVHRHIHAVSKALLEPAAKSHKIYRRISPIRPFHKLWVMKHPPTRPFPKN